jgi:ribosomal protein S7
MINQTKNLIKHKIGNNKKVVGNHIKKDIKVINPFKNNKLDVKASVTLISNKVNKKQIAIQKIQVTPSKKKTNKKVFIIKPKVTKVVKTKFNKKGLQNLSSDSVAVINSSARQLHNLKYFRVIDSIYQSFWVGRLINFFIKKGKKKAAAKQMHSALLRLKIEQNTNPLLFILELLDQAKPIFKLENYFLGKKMINYPRVVNESKRYMIALKWLRAEINSSHISSRVSPSFSDIFYDKLIEIKTAKRNSLLKKRDMQNISSVDLQDNIRFSWRRS